jgi:hypothetical protein
MQILTGEQRMGMIANATRELIETVMAARELASEPISVMLLEAADGDEDRARVLEAAGMRATFVQYAEQVERVLSKHPQKSLARYEREVLAASRDFLHSVALISADLSRDGWPSPCADMARTCATMLNAYAKCVRDYDGRRAKRITKSRRTAKSA